MEQLQERVVEDGRQTALMLFGAVACVLLIACVNVANLLLSQATARRRELAIRSAVGASVGRLVRQLLTESVLLAALGGALGIGLAYAALPLVAVVIPEHTSFFTRIQDGGLQLDSAVLAFTAGVSIASGILLGILPALRAAKPSTALLQRFRHARTHGVLIAAEVALSVVLLVGAGLMLKSVLLLVQEDLGFRSDHLLTIAISLPGEKYDHSSKIVTFYNTLLQRIQSSPGVVSAGAVVDLPLTRSWSLNDFETSGALRGRAAFHSISPAYFAAMQIPILYGRTFTERDTDRSAPVAVVNRTMADRYWGGRNVVGQTVTISRNSAEGPADGARSGLRQQTVEIVGVAADVRFVSRSEKPWPEMFLPYSQRTSNDMTLVVRTAPMPSALVPALKREIWRVDPDLPVTDLKSMDDLVSVDVAVRRFILLLLASFATVAIALAAVGIYSVVSYKVRQRRQEIGIRIALGATRANIIALIMRRELRPVAVGIVLGTLASLAVTRLLTAHLYRVQPVDLMTLCAVASLVFVCGLLAGGIPARDAAGDDPLDAIRCE